MGLLREAFDLTTLPYIKACTNTVDGGGVSVKTNWNLGFDQEPEEIPY